MKQSINTRQNLLDRFVILLIVCNLHPASSTSLPTAPSASLREPYDAESVSNFITKRCGSNNSSTGVGLWSYEGCLTDPMTGRIVAEVEGIELVKPLSVITPSSNNFTQSVLGNLLVRNLLFPRSNGISADTAGMWDSATTILSRKLFLYRQPLGADGSSSLLTSLRLRLDGPLRHLCPSESVSVYDSATTFISRNQGREMVVFSESGGCEAKENEEIKRSYLMGTVQSNGSQNKETSPGFEFIVNSQRGTILEHGPVLPPIKPHSRDELVISPPRSSFLQFGKTESISERKYDSVRETYLYSFDNPTEMPVGTVIKETRPIFAIPRWVQSRFERTKPTGLPSLEGDTKSGCTLRYSRYGEAPPWYAPGRMAMLDLKGKRVSLPPHVALPTESEDGRYRSLSSYLPKLALLAASKTKPSFWSGWPAIMHSSNDGRNNLIRQYYQLPSDCSVMEEYEMETCNRAIRSFCEGRRRTVDFENEQNRQKMSRVGDSFAKMQAVVVRIKRSLHAESIPRAIN